MRLPSLLFAVLFALVFIAPSYGQCQSGACSFQSSSFGSFEYARTMQRTRVFAHDRSFRGAEVIFRSSGTATRSQAMSSWLRSRPHAALIRAGRIKEIACSGNFCVGRGR
jgi:hypothetical protein